MFRNRKDAGIKLGQILKSFDLKNPVVYAIPRGGVAVGHEVAKALGAPMTVIAVKKVGHPQEPEFAVGAVAEGDPPVILFRPGAEAEQYRREVEISKKSVLESVMKYRKGRLPENCTGKTAIVVDDGAATGMTASAALRSISGMHPLELILAVPVIDRQVEKWIKPSCDRIVAVETVNYLQAVGSYYLEFNQMDDTEVIQFLEDPETSFRGNE